LRARSFTGKKKWQDLGGLWEHANWLDAASVTELLRAGLTKDFVAGTSNTAEALQAATATAAGQYIAVVNDRHEVRSVIDRSKLLGRLLMARGLAGPPR
jgi:hypothetical protein